MLNPGWNLRITETRHRIAQLSRYGPNGGLSLTLHALPAEIHPNAPMVALTTCAVLTLQSTATPTHAASGS